MREYLNRSRDIMQVARVLHTENPDIGLIACIGVVLGAVRDVQDELNEQGMLDIGQAIDWARKAMT